jgi:hypothetical protein
MGAEVSGQFGGLITFKFGAIVIPPSDAEVSIDPGTFEVSSKTNQDGTEAYEMKPKSPGCKIKFRNVGDVDWAAIMLQVGNVTLTEVTNGRTHLFTGTRFIGTAELNTSTGEVDGLSIRGGRYQRLTNS